MTLDEAYQQLYGPDASARAVLEHRRAVIDELRTTTLRLLQGLHDQCPTVDHVGATLHRILHARLWPWDRDLADIDATLNEAEPL